MPLKCSFKNSLNSRNASNFLILVKLHKLNLNLNDEYFDFQIISLQNWIFRCIFSINELNIYYIMIKNMMNMPALEWNHNAWCGKYFKIKVSPNLSFFINNTLCHALVFSVKRFIFIMPRWDIGLFWLRLLP